MAVIKLYFIGHCHFCQSVADEKGQLLPQPGVAAESDALQEALQYSKWRCHEKTGYTVFHVTMYRSGRNESS